MNISPKNPCGFRPKFGIGFQFLTVFLHSLSTRFTCRGYILHRGTTPVSSGYTQGKFTALVYFGHVRRTLEQDRKTTGAGGARRSYQAGVRGEGTAALCRTDDAARLRAGTGRRSHGFPGLLRSVFLKKMSVGRRKFSARHRRNEGNFRGRRRAGICRRAPKFICVPAGASNRRNGYGKIYTAP